MMELTDQEIIVGTYEEFVLGYKERWRLLINFWKNIRKIRKTLIVKWRMKITDLS